MRQAILFAAIVLALLVAVPLQGSGDAPAESSEFMLFNAEYNTATIRKSQTTIHVEKRLFKIDKTTGDTWILIDNLVEGRDVKYWKKIQDEPEA